MSLEHLVCPQCGAALPAGEMRHGILACELCLAAFRSTEDAEPGAVAAPAAASYDPTDPAARLAARWAALDNARTMAAIRVSQLVVARFKKEHGIDLAVDAMAMQRVEEASILAVHALTCSSTSYRLDLPFLAADPKRGPLHCSLEVTKRDAWPAG